MAITYEVGSVHEVFGDASTVNKTGLVSMDQQRDEGFKAVSEEFGNCFCGTVLK